jgi:hypothetical protein
MSFSGILRCAAAALGIAVVGGCGGGDTVEPFAPTGMVAFGDDVNVIEANGYKHTINGVEADGTLDCDMHRLWTQIVAADFGMKFENDTCLDAGEVPKGRSLAAPGAKVADVVTQVDTYLASRTAGAIDLGLLWVGINDIVELFGQYPAQTEAALRAEATARGKLLAEQANRIGLSGSPVVVVTAPDMGLTPLARAGGAEAMRLLSGLSRDFNAALHVNLVQDGRVIGIVFGEGETQNSVEFAGSFGYANATDALCLPSAPLPTCTTATLTIQDNPATPENEALTAASQYLWADSVHPAPNFHLRIAQLALVRARNNPF